MLTPHSFPHWQLWSVNILLLISRASSIASNRTIDDTFGDSATGALPIYSRSWSKGQNCPSCLAQPDKNATFDHTWHDTTSNSPPDSPAHNVSIVFHGTAIWVYCVVPNRIKDATTLVNITFALDGVPAGSYQHMPRNTATYDYNVTVYENTMLSNSIHTLVMTAENDPNPSILLFDWALYTVEDGSDTQPSSSLSQATSLSVNTDTPTSSASSHATTWGAAGDATASPQVSVSTGLASHPHSNTSAVIGGVIGDVSCYQVDCP
ncbi:uncharacterized protein B0H18DRAFT_483253 [Fomitopsis serialis]|uniref:uncharacterized protein n=1 Tax=Fomitopsis serialis TaxID=139415 RepID=UPI002008A62C|nr:uncharacterized protein B0H18DRAFT_483253 [Neoantrodia serialis]KAH9934655.1 hypothetical protein B0H18DRAFT_483253 [Neoantrodia serialis]